MSLDHARPNNHQVWSAHARELTNTDKQSETDTAEMKPCPSIFPLRYELLLEFLILLEKPEKRPIRLNTPKIISVAPNFPIK